MIRTWGAALTVMALAGCMGTNAQSPSGAPASHGLSSLPRPQFMTPDQMAELRKRAWQLFPLVARQKEGMPDLGYWVPELTAFSDPKKPSAKTRIRSESLQLSNALMSPRLFILQPPVELGGLETTGQTLYESTFFNPKASDYIKTSGFHRNVAPDLLAKNIRDLNFPSGSITLKTFWFVIEDGQELHVRLWDWHKISSGVDPLPQDDVCVAIKPTDGCKTPVTDFYTTTVNDPGQFKQCDGCRPLKRGQKLVLVALHIASKQVPDWLWATFWWRGADKNENHGSSWTCTDAQRDSLGAQLSTMIPAWMNYSMDVTASFRLAKPLLDADNLSCGVPGKILNDEQYLATHTTAFAMEALLTIMVRKSSCIVCHARADTDETAYKMTVAMPPGEVGSGWSCCQASRVTSERTTCGRCLTSW